MKFIGRKFEHIDSVALGVVADLLQLQLKLLDARQIQGVRKVGTGWHPRGRCSTCFVGANKP